MSFRGEPQAVRGAPVKVGMCLPRRSILRQMPEGCFLASQPTANLAGRVVADHLWWQGGASVKHFPKEGNKFGVGAQRRPYFHDFSFQANLA